MLKSWSALKQAGDLWLGNFIQTSQSKNENKKIKIKEQFKNGNFRLRPLGMLPQGNSTHKIKYPYNFFLNHCFPFLTGHTPTHTDKHWPFSFPNSWQRICANLPANTTQIVFPSARTTAHHRSQIKYKGKFRKSNRLNDIFVAALTHPEVTRAFPRRGEWCSFLHKQQLMTGFSFNLLTS